MSADLNTSGKFDLIVESMDLAAPDCRVFRCRVGGGLVHALDLYGVTGILTDGISAGIPSSDLGPLTAADGTLRHRDRDNTVGGLASVSDPVAGWDPMSDIADTANVAMIVEIPTSGSMARLKAWCVAFGGVYDQAAL